MKRMKKDENNDRQLDDTNTTSDDRKPDDNTHKEDKEHKEHKEDLEQGCESRTSEMESGDADGEVSSSSITLSASPDKEENKKEDVEEKDTDVKLCTECEENSGDKEERRADEKNTSDTWKLGPIEIEFSNDSFTAVLKALMKALEDHSRIDIAEFMSVYPWLLPLDISSCTVPAVTHFFPSDFIERIFARMGYDIQTIALTPYDPLAKRKLSRAAVLMSKFFEASIPVVASLEHEFMILTSFTTGPELSSGHLKAHWRYGEKAIPLEKLISEKEPNYIFTLVGRCDENILKAIYTALAEACELISADSSNIMTHEGYPPQSISQELYSKRKITFTTDSLQILLKMVGSLDIEDKGESFEKLFLDPAPLLSADSAGEEIKPIQPLFLNEEKEENVQSHNIIPAEEASLLLLDIESILSRWRINRMNTADFLSKLVSVDPYQQLNNTKKLSDLLYVSSRLIEKYLYGIVISDIQSDPDTTFRPSMIEEDDGLKRKKLLSLISELIRCEDKIEDAIRHAKTELEFIVKLLEEKQSDAEVNVSEIEYEGTKMEGSIDSPASETELSDYEDAAHERSGNSDIGGAEFQEVPEISKAEPSYSGEKDVRIEEEGKPLMQTEDKGGFPTEAEDKSEGNTNTNYNIDDAAADLCMKDNKKEYEKMGDESCSLNSTPSEESGSSNKRESVAKDTGIECKSKKEGESGKEVGEQTSKTTEIDTDTTDITPFKNARLP